MSVEEEGEVFLSTIAESLPSTATNKEGETLTGRLVDILTDDKAEVYQRKYCTKLLEFMLKSAGEPELYRSIGGGGASIGGYQEPVQNRLLPYRDSILFAIAPKLTHILHAALNFDPTSASTKSDAEGGASLPQTVFMQGPIALPTFEVAVPFSTFRLAIIELITLVVECDTLTASAAFDKEIWAKLIQWCVEYSHNNVYHALFYRLVYYILRQSTEEAQQVLLAEANLVEFVTNTFLEVPWRGSEYGLSAIDNKDYVPPIPPIEGIDPDSASPGGTENDKEVTPHTNQVDYNMFYQPPRNAPKALVDKFVLRGLVMNCGNAIRYT